MTNSHPSTVNISASTRAVDTADIRGDVLPAEDRIDDITALRTLTLRAASEADVLASTRGSSTAACAASLPVAATGVVPSCCPVALGSALLTGVGGAGAAAGVTAEGDAGADTGAAAAGAAGGADSPPPEKALFIPTPITPATALSTAILDPVAARFLTIEGLLSCPGAGACNAGWGFAPPLAGFGAGAMAFGLSCDFLLPYRIPLRQPANRLHS